MLYCITGIDRTALAAWGKTKVDHVAGTLILAFGPHACFSLASLEGAGQGHEHNPHTLSVLHGGSPRKDFAALVLSGMLVVMRNSSCQYGC